MIAEVPGKPVVDFSHKLLHDKSAKEDSENDKKEQIIEMASSIILDDIHTFVYNRISRIYL